MVSGILSEMTAADLIAVWIVLLVAAGWLNNRRRRNR